MASMARIDDHKVTVLVRFFEFVAHHFAGGHEFGQTGDFASVRFSIQFVKVGKPARGRVSIIAAQPARNVVVHHVQQVAVQQHVLSGGDKRYRHVPHPQRLRIGMKGTLVQRI